jgi:hypothetical protein
MSSTRCSSRRPARTALAGSWNGVASGPLRSRLTSSRGSGIAPAFTLGTTTPATIDDPAILDETTEALRRIRYAERSPVSASSGTH